MTKGTRDQRLNAMDSTVCPECGMVNDPIFSFCEECGSRLVEEVTSQVDEPEFVIQSPPQVASTHVITEEPKKKSSRLTWALVAILAIVIAAGYWGRDAGTVDEIEPMEEEVVTVEEPPIHEVDISQVSIISSDWDWDSCRKVGERYQVDYILLVKNAGDEPLTEIQFQVKDKTGANIEERNQTGTALHGVGLVVPGTSGIMVGTVTVSEKNVKPDKSTYQITNAKTNKKIEDYKLPEGKISKCHGDKNDYYDISVINTNGVTVSQDSAVVAVLLKDGKIKESDATGKIAIGIEPGASLDQKDAFYDPNLFLYQDNKKGYVVYIIDKAYLTS